MPAFTGIADYEATHQVRALVSNSENMECVLGTRSCLFLRLRPRFFLKSRKKHMLSILYSEFYYNYNKVE